MNQSKGILMVCSSRFTIDQVLYNALDEDFTKMQGENFLDLVSEADLSKAQTLLKNVDSGITQFNWELNLVLDNKVKSLVFFGTRYLDKYVLLGGYSNSELQSLFEEMMQINNEQVNYLRSTLKNMAEKIREQTKIENKSLDELTYLNNELANLQRKLTKQNVELERVNKLKNQFLGMAAHDLRNPMGNIFTFAEFLEEEATNLSKEQMTYICHIKSLSSFMLNMVEELLDVSTIESGKIQLYSEQVDLVELIRQSINFNEMLANKKKMKLFFECTVPSIVLLADKGKIEQVVVNFISNAIKYSNPNNNIIIELKKNGSEVIVSVKDKGLGIKESEMGKLFRPFQKTSTQSTRGEKSTGLGLYISKKIINAHKGKIWAESEIGKGSTFYFSLPLN